MKRFSQQFKKQANSVSLGAAEQRALRERVVSYMEYHPLPKDIRSPQVDATVATVETFKVVRIPYWQLLKWSGMTALILVCLVPLMAERAVPGDTLYAVKVRFNEELRSTLTFTPTERVEWETTRLNRRIAEARLLASEGRLTDEVEAAVAEAVREHTENAKAEIATIRETDADEAAIAELELATTLEVQATTLKGDELAQNEAAATTSIAMTNATTPTPTTRSLIAAAIEDAQALEATDATSTPPAYAKLVARVELNTTRARELFSSLEGSLSEVERSDLERRLADVERAVAAALTLATEDELAARFAMIEVLQRTQRLIVFMTNLDVATNVSIEELVPMVPTTEEQTTRLRELRVETDAALETINERFVELTDESLREKATSAVARIATLRASSSAAVTAGALDDALTLSTEANSLAVDTEQLIVVALDPTPSPVIVEETSTTSVPVVPPATTTPTTTNVATTTPSGSLPAEVATTAESVVLPEVATSAASELTATATSGELVDSEN